MEILGACFVTFLREDGHFLIKIMDGQFLIVVQKVFWYAIELVFIIQQMKSDSHVFNIISLIINCCLLYFNIQCCLHLSTMPPEIVGEKMEPERFYDAANFMLSIQVRKQRYRAIDNLIIFKACIFNDIGWKNPPPPLIWTLIQ